MSLRTSMRNLDGRLGKKAERKWGNKGKVRPKNTYSEQEGQKRDTAKGVYRQNEKSRSLLSRILPSFKGFWLVFFCICIIGLSLTLLCFGVLFAYDKATTSAYFETEFVKVTGNRRLSSDMVQEIAGVNLGENSLDFSIAAMESALLKTPWVEKVSVKRELPNGFIIDIQETMPAFWVQHEGTLYYADIQGNVIAPLEAEHFMLLPTLEVEVGSEGELALLEEYIEDLKSGYLPLEFSSISAIKLTAAGDMELYIDNKNIMLNIAMNDWEKNLRHLSVAMTDLENRGELSQIHELRATDGNVWAMKNV